MSQLKINGPRIAGISTCVPKHRFDNVKDTTEFTKDEVRKVVAMAGVSARRVVDGETCSTDLCFGAAEALLKRLDCDRSSIDVLIMVTQTPDYFMPSSSCLLQERLGLSQECAAFDVGLGCSGYVYALWLAAALMAGGHQRVLLLHGETPTLYASDADRSVSLLFGDAGSATLLESPNGSESVPWSFVLRTDGHGFKDLIVEAGGFRDRFSDENRKHYVSMHGSNVFNFTINVLPPLMRDTLDLAGMETNDVDYYVFHQSNRFIMNHVMKKAGLPKERVPIILGEFGNPGGPSVPLTITQGELERPEDRALVLMLLGYGVGLSWGSALLPLDPEAVLCHEEWPRG
jgi:3-oxoacyl-[acyl-carrier-protein] synthase-3